MKAELEHNFLRIYSYIFIFALILISKTKICLLKYIAFESYI